jgi:hypothetical protein
VRTAAKDTNPGAKFFNLDFCRRRHANSLCL